MSTHYYLHQKAMGSSYTLLDDTRNLSESYKFKMVIIGDSGCGKTSLMTSFVKGEFPSGYEPTIFENSRAYIQDDSNGDIIALDLWDTAGQEDYARLRKMSYSETSLVILAYSVDQISSLQNIQYTWAPELVECAPNAPIVLVGLKDDLENKVSSLEAYTLAKDLNAVAHMRVSARTFYNVNELFNACVNTCLNVYAPKHDSTKRHSHHIFDSTDSSDQESRCCTIV